MSMARRKVALVFAGEQSITSRPEGLERSRLGAVAASLSALGLVAEPVAYTDLRVADVRTELLSMDGVLVWVNPLGPQGNRAVLDEMLREIASAGIFVSAHPDTILKMGTKEVLFETREMSWGSDTRLYRSAAEFSARFPETLAEGKPRVLKRYRGNGGEGVWKVELARDRRNVQVRHALRGSGPEEITLSALLIRLGHYFDATGRVIDQVFQPRLAEGMVRCYLVQDEVVGFGEQLINALHPISPGAAPEAPGPRLYYPPSRADFQGLKTQLETEWLPQLQRQLGLGTQTLPAIWDADFLYGPKTASGADTFVLCEINVSSVSPFPDEALDPLSQHVRLRLGS